MSLNLEELQALKDAGLDELFTAQLDLWTDMAKRAYAYVQPYIEPETHVRVDDVILVLEPALRVAPLLTDYLEEKRLRQKYWTRWFGDYILDQIWQTLQEHADEPGATQP